MREEESKTLTRSIAVAILIGAAWLSVNCLAAQAPTPARARQLLETGDYKGAIAAFQSILALDGSNREARVGLARAMTAVGDYANAESKLRQFAASSPDDPAIQNALGEVLMQTGRYAEAGDTFDRASKSARAEDWLRAVFGKGRSLIARGQDDDARSLLNQFVSYFTANSPASAPELTLIAQGLDFLERFHDSNSLYQA
ncbi:MAG TPA: tetratricopeptide repeat protein, partial [Blastocatellia bacterium]|nr:tetratricopeptide repeat protein [Blastocatellia bacterium]